jgi:hypothetical protein
MKNIMNKDTGIETYEASEERLVRNALYESLINCPIPTDQIQSNLGLFIDSKLLSRFLFFNEVYKLTIDIPGVITEFGCRWGQNLALLMALRGIYEPFNRHRKIIGFDTFDGFEEILAEDGNSDLMRVGNLSTTDGYFDYLDQILKNHEALDPLRHIKRFEIIKGDASEMLHKYLESYPETIFSLVYFDMDIYSPTRKCLDIIKPRLTKGSIIGFDEINDHDSPGETLALMESFGLNNISLRRHKYTSRVSYFVCE